MTIGELWQVLSALQTPANGALHCRSCSAGHSNKWQHRESCAINNLTIEVEQARAIVKREIEAYEQRDPYEAHG